MINKQALTAAAFAGMFVFGIVMALLGAILPHLFNSLRLSDAQAGNLLLISPLAMLAASLAFGPLVDRFGLKRVLAVASFLVALALALVASAASYRGITAAIFLLGLGGGALNGGTNVLVSDLHPERRGAALNLLGIFFGFGAAFIPLFIGSLIGRLRLEAILGIASGLALIPALAFLALGFPPARHAAGFPFKRAAEVLGTPLVFLFGLMLFFQSGNEFAMGGWISTHVIRNTGSGERAALIVLSLYWLALMAGRLVSSRLLLRLPGEKLIVCSAAASSISILIFTRASRLETAAAGAMLIGLSFAAIFPTILAEAGERYAEFSGTVFGMLFAMALVGGMTVPWAAGHVAQDWGLGRALLLPALNGLIIAAIASRLRRKEETKKPGVRIRS